MKKGFIRVSKNAEQLQQEIKKLNQHGVPSDSIFLERNLSLVLPQLEKGDTIVVCSLAHICGDERLVIHHMRNTEERDRV